MNPTLKKKYWQLRKDLHGNFQTVADRSGKNKATVSRVLNGLIENDEILDVAIQVRKEVLLDKEKAKKTREKKLNNIK